MSSEITKHISGLKHYNDVKELLQFQKLSIVQVGKHLSALRKDGRFRYVFGDSDRSQSWAEWVRYEFKISESYASRSIDIYDILIKKLGLTQEEILDADQNSLYKLLPAYKHEKITEEQLREYLPLTRNEVQQKLNPHQHTSEKKPSFAICDVCGHMFKSG